jgi:pimeloyl-ACP methyl ester carboxylesterase
MNGVMYLASGAQPHPTAMILHGLPGNEQNLDLAQTMRSAGFNVLTFHYRGSWGSPGTFTLSHGVEDGQAALEFLRDPENVAKFRIDTKRLLIVGHSYGGFVAARVAASHPEILGAALIAPWNLGDDITFLKVPESQLPEVAHKMFDDIEGRLGGTTSLEMAREMLAPGRDWRLETSAPAIRNLPLFVAVAERDAEDCRAASLLAALKRLGAPDVKSVTMSTDHSFSDHRAALQNAILDWLQRSGL